MNVEEAILLLVLVPKVAEGGLGECVASGGVELDPLLEVHLFGVVDLE